MANLTDNPNGINQEELAKELQRLRDVEGVTFAAIANKTGISRSAISQLVNQGLRVKSEHAQKLLDAVNERADCAVILVTHSPEEADALGCRIIPFSQIQRTADI